jgi:hypothetical protein
LREKIKCLKRKEFDDLLKRSKIVDVKRENLERIKRDEEKMKGECRDIEEEIRTLNVVIRN